MSNNNILNRGWLYYKAYFEENINISKTNQSIINQSLIDLPFFTGKKEENSNYYTFDLTTIYPGLLIGSGYTHEYANNGDAFKIGFFFDHISGMPIIPGSSVKGLLRSVFPQNIISPAKKIAFRKEKTELIKDILKTKCKLPEELNIDTIEKEIFEGNKDKPISIYQRDIFFDAVPIEIVKNNRGTHKNLLGEDYITPHINKDNPELNGLTNPNPLKFLKIMPEVKIQFRFRLSDGIITAKQKLELFKAILLDIGIGAKTNVGYGQFK